MEEADCEYINLWRVDCETLECKEAKVSRDAPIGEWIYSWGEPYCYTETEKAGKKLLAMVLSEKIQELQLKLEETQ